MTPFGAHRSQLFKCSGHTLAKKGHLTAQDGAKQATTSFQLLGMGENGAHPLISLYKNVSNDTCWCP